MRHYEIVLLIHPDQSSQVPAMIDRYKTIIEKNGGKIHREEDWGRRPLAYSINKAYKAHYLMFNIECDQEALNDLEYAFRYNDAVLRKLVIKRDSAITTPSHMMKPDDEKESRGGYHQSTSEDYAQSDEGDN